MDQPKTIKERVAISLAVQRNVRAAERFEQATNEYNESCAELRKVLKSQDRFVVNVNHKMHLVTSDAHGNFQIEEVDAL